MKKYFKKILLVFLSIIILSACTMEETINIKIDKDGKTTLGITLILDNDTIDEFIHLEDENKNKDTITDEDRWNYLENAYKEKYKNDNYQLTKYEEDDLKGYTATITINSIDDISSQTLVDKVAIIDIVNNNEEITNKSLFIKEDKIYKSNMIARKDMEEGSDELEYEGEDNDILEYLLVITLPHESIKNNASLISEDKKTLTWNLLRENNIELEFSLSKNNNNLIEGLDNKYLLFGGIGLLGLIMVIILFISTKNK